MVFQPKIYTAGPFSEGSLCFRWPGRESSGGVGSLGADGCCCLSLQDRTHTQHGRHTKLFSRFRFESFPSPPSRAANNDFATTLLKPPDFSRTDWPNLTAHLGSGRWFMAHVGSGWNIHQHLRRRHLLAFALTHPHTPTHTHAHMDSAHRYTLKVRAAFPAAARTIYWRVFWSIACTASPALCRFALPG